jgi:hypothetical protein
VEELAWLPPVRWLIPVTLAAGELHCLYGKGGAYKSFVALDWACYLAHHGVTVVYIVAEGASGTRVRIAAWKKKHGVETLPNLRLMPANVSLHDPASLEVFLDAWSEQLRDLQPGLVIVDTLARNFVGGNVNSPQDLNLFVEGCEAIRRTFGTAVLVIHHTGKDGGTELGTEALRNACFGMFKCVRLNQSLRVRIEYERVKDFREQPPPRTIALDQIPLPEFMTEDGEEVSSLVALWPYDPAAIRIVSRRERDRARYENDTNLSRRDKKVLTLVGDANGDANRAWLAKQLKISSAVASNNINSLVKRGFIDAEGSTRDRRFKLSAAGRRAVK